MHRRSLPAALLLLVLAPAGCAGGGDQGPLDGGDETDGADDDDADDGTDEGGTDEGGLDEGGLDEGGSEEGGDDDNDDDGDDDGVEVEHALGVIALSEAHGAEGGVASGFVTASFIPDAAAGVGACTEEVAGCRISVVPDCPSGCGEDQYCGFADGCASTCLDVCDASCDDDEVCYFAAPGQAACRDVEDFDAGSLSFTGTTTPITLFPPYVAEGFETGAPFAPGGEITVAASGAAATGFDAFEERFGATTLLQTDLDQVAIGEAYGDADMPVEWSGGADDITISVTVSALDGAYGTVTCEADDGAGAFDVPREAILAALGDQAPASVAVAITRSRTELVEGIATKGELLYGEVKPEGWLELTTASTESHVIEGCSWGELVCGDDCVDVLWDPENCGGCGEPCSGECYDGECLTEDDNDTCSDGWDNDGDGYYDCEDFDCTSNPAVTVCDSEPEDTDALCDDGLDNDGDGYYDCDDFDCSMNVAVTVCDAADGSSCVGHCGGQAPGGCYCDNACSVAGDCCADYVTAC